MLHMGDGGGRIIYYVCGAGVKETAVLHMGDVRAVPTMSEVRELRKPFCFRWGWRGGGGAVSTMSEGRWC